MKKILIFSILFFAVINMSFHCNGKNIDSEKCLSILSHIASDDFLNHTIKKDIKSNKAKNMNIINAGAILEYYSINGVSKLCQKYFGFSEIIMFRINNSDNKYLNDKNKIIFANQYECINYDDILNGNKVIANIESKFYNEESYVHITALIPLKSNNEELSYLKIKFIFNFGLQIKHNNSSVEKAVAILNERVMEDPNCITGVEGYLSYNFMTRFSWALSNAYIFSHKFIELERSKNNNVYELFRD